jgi:hypothetical protein
MKKYSASRYIEKSNYLAGLGVGIVLNLFFALFELTVAYLFASLAIDSGSLWQYAVAILLFIGAIQNFVRIFKGA